MGSSLSQDSCLPHAAISVRHLLSFLIRPDQCYCRSTRAQESPRLAATGIANGERRALPTLEATDYHRNGKESHAPSPMRGKLHTPLAVHLTPSVQGLK